MFWRYGGFANVSTIDTLLDKSDVTLEELLDESDLIQELKQRNTKLLQYLDRESILDRLLEYVVAPKLEAVQHWALGPESKEGEQLHIENQDDVVDDETRNKQRNRYAYVAAEVLSSDNWSICVSLMENQHIMKKFWEFLKLQPPLDPLQASYFTKVNESLLDRKTEEMLAFFKTCEGVVEDILRHIDSPMIMDLLLKVISLEKGEGGQGIVDWLYKQNLMPKLISFLSSEHSWVTQTSAGDFLKAIIAISANATPPSCVGPNELTRQLVSQPCIEELIQYMLKGGNPLTVGVGIVIEVIRKNNSDFDPLMYITDQPPSSRDPVFLAPLLRLFAQRIPDFMALMHRSDLTTEDCGNKSYVNRRKELNTAFGEKIEPLGFDRFKICELMAELLHCSNMRLLNEVGVEEEFRGIDIERERLRAEGKLAISIDKSAIPSFETQRRRRKLQIQNTSDYDGFQQLSQLGSNDDTNGCKNPEPPNFMESSDEEFVDGNLSSRIETADSDVSDLTVLPLSPIKGISKKIHLLGLEGKKYDNIIGQEKYGKPMWENNPTIANTDESSVELNPDLDSTHTKIEAISNECEPLQSADDGKDSHGSPPFKSDTEDMQEDSLKNDSSSFEKQQEKYDHLSLNMNYNSEENSADPSTRHEFTSREVDSIMEESKGDDSQSIDIRIAIGDYPAVGDFLKTQFVEHNVIQTILDFFFRFPWNNFLHNVVYDVVQQVFNSDIDSDVCRYLAFDLFRTGDITTRIVSGQRKSDNMARMRLGYMGHLTLIAEEVVKFTEENPPDFFPESVLNKIMNSDWISYVEITLAETRMRDNAILGGFKPHKPAGQRPASTSISAGFGTTLAEPSLNRFGSNDEEDDEMAGAELITDIPPPATPPPLSSLHILPSRARLQFAARVALHRSEKDEDIPTDDYDVSVSATTEAKQRTTLDDGESDELPQADNTEESNTPGMNVTFQPR